MLGGKADRQFTGLWGRSMRPPCPKCGSYHHRKALPGEAGHLGSFQVLAARRCRDCGYTWEPPAPRWLLKFGLVTGTAWFLWGAGLMIGEGGIQSRWLGLCGMGVIVIAGCWHRLSRRERGAQVPNIDTPARA
jgi:hypothetical protein